MKLRFGKARSCVWKREVEREREWAPAGRLGLFPMSFYRRDVVCSLDEMKAQRRYRRIQMGGAQMGDGGGVSLRRSRRYITGMQHDDGCFSAAGRTQSGDRTRDLRAQIQSQPRGDPRGSSHETTPRERSASPFRAFSPTLMSATVHLYRRTESRRLTSTHLIRHELARTGRILRTPTISTHLIRDVLFQNIIYPSLVVSARSHP